MKDKLLIIDKIKKTIIYVDSMLDNYPHRFIELRSNINNSLYELLNNCYLANDGIDVINNKKKSIINIKIIDFYLMLSYKKELISKKKYLGLSKHLLEIKNMIYGWINYSEESE